MDYTSYLHQQQSPPQPHPPLLHQDSSLFQDSTSQGATNSSFDPLPRARSNTWPCRPSNVEEPAPATTPGYPETDPGYQQKKQTSRRNAWGNMSYADLITQAIGSSPEKRLTLSQIYDWMVGNVGYFKDKGDSNSSAGWKNSIRHNLSLHNRFVRVQNEGTGKSSWWMLNPDAKPGKAARRRATSMETSKYEKKRGRIRKKIEAMRNGVTLLDTPSPCSSISEGLDLFPLGEGEPPSSNQQFQLSPCSDFRPRASSNASSCGRLSPILGETLDLHDNQVPPLSPWPDYYQNSTQLGNGYSLGFGLEEVQLAGNLANMVKIQEFGGSQQQQDPSFYSFEERGQQMGGGNVDFYDFQKTTPPLIPPSHHTLQNPSLSSSPSLSSTTPTTNHTHSTNTTNKRSTPNSANNDLDFGFDQLGQFEHDILANSVELANELQILQGGGGEWLNGSGQGNGGQQQQVLYNYLPSQQQQQLAPLITTTSNNSNYGPIISQPVTSSPSSGGGGGGGEGVGRMWVH